MTAVSLGLTGKTTLTVAHAMVVWSLVAYLLPLLPLKSKTPEPFEDLAPRKRITIGWRVTTLAVVSIAVPMVWIFGFGVPAILFAVCCGNYSLCSVRASQRRGGTPTRTAH